MNELLSTPSLRNILKFPFVTKEWIVPFIIGTALIFAGMIIPIIPLIFVYGYLALVMRMSINGEVMLLPAWNNWGRLFKDGLRSLAVGAIYLGPGIIVSMIGFSAYIVMFVASIALTELSFDFYINWIGKPSYDRRDGHIIPIHVRGYPFTYCRSNTFTSSHRSLYCKR